MPRILDLHNIVQTHILVFKIVMYFLSRQKANCLQTNKYPEKDINKNVFKNYTDKYLSQRPSEKKQLEKGRASTVEFSRGGEEAVPVQNILQEGWIRDSSPPPPPRPTQSIVQCSMSLPR